MPSISSNARATLLAKRNVKATYTRQDGTVVVVVSRKVPINQLAKLDLVPAAVEGRSTDVVVWGEIRAPRDPIQAPQTFTRKMRPCPGGFSVGHHLITAGTLGLWVMKDGKPHILSNNHVLANSNEAVAGDWILQPGRADGGSVTDSGFYAARLADFVKINHEDPGDGGGELPPGCLNLIPWRPKTRALEQPFPNLVDAALAEEFGNTYTPEIHGMGRPVKVREAVLGENVKKAGRTTEFTHGVIEALDLTVEVSYGNFTALFEDQLLIVSRDAGPFSQGGDSGSAILNYDGQHLLGLLYAGGTDGEGRDVTIANKAPIVQSLLGFEL